MKHTYIGIIANSTPDLAAGLLGILKSGNSFVPISPACPNDRIDFIIKDCGIKVLLADRANYEKARQVANNNPLIEHLLCTDDEAAGADTNRKTRDKDIDKPCYVIYTSGSTGQPKGVPITHRNLIPLFSWFRDYFDLGTHTRVMQNLSYTFDFGVFEILTTILYGGCLYLLDKEKIGGFAFYSEFINRHLINTVHSTPVFFSSLVSAAEKMPSLQLVHLGGERLTGKIVKSTSRLVPPGCLIHNGYGPTEATINCSIFTLTADRAADIQDNAGIPIGHPTAWNILYILDKYHKPQPIGAAGELCVAGAGLARGYLNRPELTVKKFCLRRPGGSLFEGTRGLAPLLLKGTGNNPLQSYRHATMSSPHSPIPPIPHSPIYLTGDLTRWLADGNIEFLGRIDFQVKVRGYRIELGEIENHLLKHPDTREAVVIAREHENGSQYLCAYVVSSGLEPPPVTRLREHLAANLPDYMIPAYFIPLERMPLTGTGKVDRNKLPEPDETMIAKGVEYAAPVTDIEKSLVKIWQGLLKIEKIGIMDDFFELGGDSILANQCIARIREELETEVPLRKFFERPYIHALSGEIGRKKQQPVSISRASRDGLIPLSFAQERLWFLQTLDASSTAYFVPRVIRIKGKLSVRLIEQTFTEIIRRHEILRTLFPTIDGQPVQQVQPPYIFKIPVIDWTRNNEEQQIQQVSRFLKEESQRPFDFEKGPLLRVTLLKLKPGEHLFVLTEHHLIHDGWTQGVLLREFIEIFTAFSHGQECQLPELPIQYADFAIWQRQFLHGEVLEKHLEYWRKKLQDLAPVLELPIDRPRPSVISGRGAMKPFHLSTNFTRKLKNFSRQNDATLFMVMLAVFKVFLYRYTGVDDLCVGTGIANRGYKELEGMLGMIINTLPLRTRWKGDIGFNHMLKPVKETCLEAYQHEDTPFGKIVEVMQPERNLSYTPLFQVMFSFMDTPGEDLRLPGLELQLEDFHNRSAKFDINVVVVPPAEHEQETGVLGTLVEWEYNTDIFDASTIERMIRHYTRLLEEILLAPDTTISALPMLTKEEIHQLVVTFNETAGEFPRDKAVHQLFQQQAGKTPDNITLHGCTDARMHDVVDITYGELDEKTNQLARMLRQKGVGPDTIVGVMMDRSVDLIISIFAVLRAGGAYLPIDPDYPQERINYMLSDSHAKILLTSQEIDNIFSPQAFNNSPKGTPSHLHLLPAPATCLAYIIYTSGTTGRPRGTMVQHSSLVNLCTWHNRCYRVTGRDHSTQYANIGFDASVWEIFPPLIAGAVLHIIDEGLRINMEALNDYFEKHHITISFLPTPVCHQFIKAENHSLRILLTGGDKLQAFVKRRYALYNNYGPTENTVVTTSYLVESSMENIPVGKPIANTRVYILGKDYLQLQPMGVPGELCIAGDSLARGYLNNPELTVENYLPMQPYSHAAMRLSPHPLPHYPIYRTGDLARYLSNGNIQFLGRIDQQVKIRGVRIELGEIENRLLTHHQVKEAVVIDRETENKEKYLCAYIVTGEGTPPGPVELKNYLAVVLPGYMVPSFFVPIEEIPLTLNGKVDRKALPMPAAAAAKEYTPPRDSLEEQLAQIWVDVLDIKSKDPLQASIGIDDNFFDLGGHSLNATIIIARIHRALKVKIPVAELFKRPCIRELAQYITQSPESQFAAVEPVEKKEFYPLSTAHKRLYILYQMDDIGTTYNIPTVQMLEGVVDKDRLGVIFKKLVERHESFRTCFIEIDDEPVQRIHDENLKLQITNYKQNTNDKLQITSIIKNFIRPFDISLAPLLRVGLVKMAPDRHLLMLDMHHIISDGTSHNIVVKELITLYRGEEPPALRIQYKDYSQWKTLTIGSELLKHQENYWKIQFQEEIPVLNLPLDYPRPSTQGFAGNRVHFEIAAGETNALKQYAHEQGVTLYMLLLAVLNVFLSKITLQEDIIIGTPIAARRHAHLEPVIGMFVNTLALRNYPQKEKTFTAFLKEVKERTLSAYENQDYPFETLVEVLAIDRDASRNPLFDVLFALQNMESYPVQELPGLKITPYPYENRTSKFDLYLSALEKEEKLALTMEYSTRLFRQDTILRMTGFFKQVIAAVIKNPSLKLEEIEIINEREKEKILQVSQGIKEPLEKHKTIHGWFEEKARAIPGRTALVFKEELLTYGELNRRANQLAGLLKSKGVGPDTVVGLMVRRSIEMIIGILAIMKTGGAYLPIDTAYPEVRKTYMLQDSGVSLLLINDEIENSSYAIPGAVETLDTRSLHIYRENTGNPVYTGGGNHLVYVIYTSGSTGTPRGIMMQHSNLLNLVQYQFKYTNIPFERVLQFTTISFDVSFQEICSTLLAGGTLILIDNETRSNVDELFGTIEKNVIGTLFLPASFLKSVLNEEVYLENIPRDVRHIVTAGEQVIVSARLCRYLQQRGVWLHNHYGPAETHVVTTLIMDPAKEIPELPPIGQPIQNTDIYILDRQNHLQPIGVPGEVVIGGIQVGRGYLNNPELTAGRFLSIFYKSYTSYKTYISKKIYKTGDLARWLPDGNIEFLGRMDYQVKIRGFRIEPGEIEHQLLAHPAVKEAVVIDRQGDNNEKYLCAYITAGRGARGAERVVMPGTSELREHLLKTLPDYMIPSFFVPLDEIPLTPNGKIDRKALPLPAIDIGKSLIAPGDTVEKQLVKTWEQVLFGECTNSVDIDGNFFEMGGHSLKAVILISKIHQVFHVKVPLAEFFRSPRIRSVSRYIREAEKTAFKELEKIEEKEFYPLSYNQERLFVLQYMQPRSPAYNISARLMLAGKTNEKIVETVLKHLVARHESLRTGIKIINDEPMQFIDKTIVLPFRVIDISSLAPGEKQQKCEEIYKRLVLTPFDLEAFPLFRVLLVKWAPDQYELMLNLHHIISDGWSMEILQQEFLLLSDGYSRGKAVKLEPLVFQYKDFVQWHHKQMLCIGTNGEESPAMLFWKKKLAGRFPTLQLPGNSPETGDETSGAAYQSTINKKLKQELYQLAENYHTSLFVVMFSLYIMMLSRLSGQQDIVCSVIVAGREHASLQDIVGLFVNTVIFGIHVDENEAFEDFLKRVSADVIETFQYQGFPMELVFKELIVKYPEIPVSFNMLNMQDITGHQQLDSFEDYHLDRMQDVKFDLEPYITEYENGIKLLWVYRKSLFEPAAIQYIAELYKNLAEFFVRNPNLSPDSQKQAGKKYQFLKDQ